LKPTTDFRIHSSEVVYDDVKQFGAFFGGIFSGIVIDNFFLLDGVQDSAHFNFRLRGMPW
jgi:NHS family xanthosine MFS transporter